LNKRRHTIWQNLELLIKEKGAIIAIYKGNYCDRFIQYITEINSHA